MIRGKTVSDILVEYEIILPEEREIVTYGIKQTVISLGHIALFLGSSAIIRFNPFSIIRYIV